MAFEPVSGSAPLPESAPRPWPATRPEPRTRVPLGGSPRRLSYDRRLRLGLLALAAPGVVCVGLLAAQQGLGLTVALSLAAGTALAYAVVCGMLFDRVTRPLQTLSNVVAALRDEDFSFRARGARRGDSLGDLALEINSLAGTLQIQHGSARDALTLAERVMDAMRAPVLAFAADSRLAVLNPAAESAFGLSAAAALGRSAAELGFAGLYSLEDGAVLAHPAVSGVAGETRWSVRRSTFRIAGVPHHLFVLSGVDAALREEERVAWQRLVRVLSHEINNSLTPITSLAGSLRSRLAGAALADGLPDIRRGLHLIEDRALSLHRFVQAYQQLSRLPRPALRAVPFSELVQRVVALEARLAVCVVAGPEVVVTVDPDQMEQLLINLLRNAVEAALGGPEQGAVTLRWLAPERELTLRIEDTGPGLSETANLFVPFYTTKPGGSGIGLVLAQQIATAHGGALSLRNREGAAGCVAELRLPLGT